MTTSSEPDDDWAEFARELEDNTRPSPAEPDPPEEAEPGGEASADADGFEDPEAAEAGEADGLAGDDEGGTEGQPGTGRKRRRRRRRRRKGGGAQSADAAAEEAASEPVAEADEPEIEDEPEPVAETDDDEAEDYTGVDSEVEAAEDAGGELLRELIANWNVPSWDDIVGGLHRPDR